MIKSPVTNKIYDPDCCIYICNVLQCQKYLSYLGPEYLYDVLWSSSKRENALVFVFPKCDRTREAKRLWDAHEL